MVKIKFQLAFAMIAFVILIAIFAATAGAFGLATNAPVEQPDVLANIKTASAFTDADARYLQTSLLWLRDYLPDWYAYVAEAKPFVVSVDEELAQRGMISRATCCTTRGTGAIAFGGHLGQWRISEAARVEGMQTQQPQFLSVLVHEVTHLRDQRSGRIGEAVDSKTCIAAERSANTKELEFARALTTVRITGDASAQENYRLVVTKHLEMTEDYVDGVSWKIACLLFYSE